MTLTCPAPAPTPAPTISHGGPVRDYISLVDNLSAADANVQPAGEGALKDYGSGEATKQQLKLVLAEIRKYADSCEIRMDGKEILVKASFRE